MRKTPETGNDVAVGTRVAIDRGGLRKSLERLAKRAGALLVLERLAVLEGQVGEHSLHREQVAVPALVDQMLRRLERERVSRKCRRRAAMDMARELVEHEDARQVCARRLQPFAMPAIQHFLVQLLVALRDQGVEGRVLLEPALLCFAVIGAVAEPEAQYFRC